LKYKPTLFNLPFVRVLQFVCHIPCYVALKIRKFKIILVLNCQRKICGQFSKNFKPKNMTMLSKIWVCGPVPVFMIRDPEQTYFWSSIWIRNTGSAIPNPWQIFTNAIPCQNVCIWCVASKNGELCSLYHTLQTDNPKKKLQKLQKLSANTRFHYLLKVWLEIKVRPVICLKKLCKRNWPSRASDRSGTKIL
jgi:hypothetical protein